MQDHGPNGSAAAAPDAAVLIVDDNAASRLALRAMLAPLGHTVVEADSGRAALREVTKQSFAVVLMDVRMPTLDGFETAKLIRRRRQSALTPIIFLTAYGGDEIETATAYARGAVDFIFAPIRPEVLHAKVSTFVDLFVQAEELRSSLESVSVLNAALRDSEVRARAVLQNVVDGIVTAGEGGRIESFNRSAQRLFGYREDEVVGQPLNVILAPGHHEEFSESARATAEVLTAKEIPAEPAEMVGLRKDGSTFPMELDMSQMHIGERTFTIGCIRDISARKQAETEKADLEAQLRETQKMEAIGRLAGGIAHDFNNLLTVIGGYTDELLTGLAEQPELRGAAEEVRHAADRATAMTAQLLTFSRRQRLEPRTLDLNAVVGNIEPMLRRLIGDDLVLVSQLDPALEPVTADPSQIDQVIMNLAVNARDAMPTGGTLTIRTSHEDLDEDYVRRQPAGTLEPGRYVILSLTDTGVGIDKQTQSQIFDPFFTTREIGKGTGLGLATVYGIARQSGGFVRVSSEPGSGATFKVALPTAEGAPEEPSRAPSVGPDATVAPGSETVLLVEDDESVRRLVGRILKSHGYTVLEAATGSAALQVCDTHEGEIHLVLSDTVMPGISGPELSDQLLARRPEVNLLFMSGYSARALRDRGRDADAAFIQKPFTSDDLARAARTLLDSPEKPTPAGSAER
jgi:two-component system, cell cycle sensor histidine kinase and response regulator CckA